MIYLEGIPSCISTCLHSCPHRMKLSREVAYKYITIRTQYSSFVAVLAIPEPSDFPFCSAQRDSGSVYMLYTGTRAPQNPSIRRIRTMPARENIIQSIRRSVLLEIVDRIAQFSILVSPFSRFPTSSFNPCVGHQAVVRESS